MKLWFGEKVKKCSQRRATALIQPWNCEQAWWLTMGFAAGPPPSLEHVEKRFRRLASTAHPDHGGSAGELQALLRARHRARQQYRHS